jgi:hypothetical protein
MPPFHPSSEAPMRLSFLLLGLGLSTAALAHPGGHMDGEMPYRPPTAATAPTAIPATYPDVVTALRDHASTAGVALGAAKIVDLHREVRALNDLLAALPTKGGALSTEAKATLAQTAAHLQEQVNALVIAADKGNTSNGTVALTAIRADLDVLAALK